MTIRLGINGMGRIGRRIVRLVEQEPDLEVVHVNDLAPTESMAHLLQYDSIHGTFAASVKAEPGAILINNQKIRCTQEKDPAQIPWQESACDLVLECTGRFRDRSQCELHLGGSVKKVVLSAPGKEVDLTVVMGVNQDDYQAATHHVVSNASCTTNCLAPVAMVLDERFGIRHGYMTTIHSYTNDQRLLDSSHRDPRRARAGALSQVPTTTGAARAIGLVLPNLKGKLEGMSIRVPTPNVSLVDLVVEVKQDCEAKAINTGFQEEAQGRLKGYLNYTEEPLVSSDYNGTHFSAVVDGLCTQVVGNRLVKVLAWYDNETGFSARMVDLTKHIGKKL